MKNVKKLQRTGVILVAILALGVGCRNRERHRGAAPPSGSGQSDTAASSAGSALDFTKPSLDLTADRLAERVDGAEVKLRSLGCRRLMVWRWPQQQADLELFVFDKIEGATKMLAEQIGGDRTPNVPGDEGWIGSNVLYFRRGTSFARVVADGPRESADLLAMASALARAMTRGDVVP